MARRIEDLFNIPMLPNFIRLKGSGDNMGGLSIENFSNAELRRIGRLWTDELIKHAEKRRKINTKNK